ncbi:nitroreductase family protein [Roseiarcus fermentans]|uniref:Nitroreductase family protein n=1 Tax=Roseiarcus fermentans TaxID=1473586 RepID=A0A366F6Z1_9HYPH|nr:nitroreductase family protein [Roseiarcus fermentans]
MEDAARRRFLGVVAGAGVVAAAGGAAAYIASSRDAGAYDAAVEATWRHSDSFDLPAPDARKDLVRYATLAANSHNTQPWQFRLPDRAILVLPDLTRRLASVDPDNHHLFASLGCATENLVQAAAAFGLRANATFDAAAGGIRVDLEQAPAAHSPLFDAIPRRQSTRGVFDGRAVPAEHLRLLEAAGSGDGVTLRLFTERKSVEDILGFLVAGNSAQMDDAAFVAELKSWLRFNYAEAIATDDGLFSKCTGAPTLPSWLGRLIFSLVVTKDDENKTYAAQLRSSAGVAVFISDTNEPASWSAAGRCCQRFALQATALGIRHCFINQPVEVPAVRGQFAAFLGVGDRRPDLVMRFGYGPELPRSLRRPVDQVLHAA